MAKKKASNLKQLDILQALKGIEVFIDEEDDKEILTEKKSLTIFDIMTDIRKDKTFALMDKEQNVSSFDSFMIIKGLSMKTDDIPILQFANKYMSVLDKKQMYQLLSYIIPKDNKTFYKWITSEKEKVSDSLPYICSYFECSESEAMEYISIMGEDWAKSIKSKFGDFSKE